MEYSNLLRVPSSEIRRRWRCIVAVRSNLNCAHRVGRQSIPRLPLAAPSLLCLLKFPLWTFKNRRLCSISKHTLYPIHPFQPFHSDSMAASNSSSAPLLPPRAFPLPRENAALAVFHFRNETIDDELAKLCCDTFNQIVEDGKTYPMVRSPLFGTFL